MLQKDLIKRFRLPP